MDDAKLANGMTLDDIGRRLDTLQSDMSSVKSIIESLQTNVTSLQAEMQTGFKRVDEELNAAKIRDEEAHRLLKFGLEAREGFCESVEARFDEADKKHDDQIGLLKQVIQHLATQQTGT
jgi:hypothetical protein